jgi:hypothetical protein
MSPTQENKMHTSHSSTSSSSLVTDDYCRCNNNDEVIFVSLYSNKHEEIRDQMCHSADRIFSMNHNCAYVYISHSEMALFYFS